MKLKRPRVDSYTSPDGNGSLTYIGLDASHDMGGSDYRFLYTVGSQEVEISARVQSILRANHAAEAEAEAEAEGIDLWSMALEESDEFKEAYYEHNPRDYQVIRFFAKDKGKDVDLTAAAKRFCDLLLKLNSSYKFNNSHYPEMGDGYYWEKVFFQPHDADSKTHFQYSVGTPQ